MGVVTHELNVAGQFCDRLLLMSAGAGEAAEGTPGEVLTEELLSQAYGARIRVAEHPLTGTPLVCPEEAARC